MRAEATADAVRRLLVALAQAARGPGNVYLTGGATAVLLGWREATIDVDLKFDPEPPGVFDAIPRIKDELNLNIELAAPDDFLPALPGWRERSQLIDARGPLRFYHYDFYSQALAKIERGHAQDAADVRDFLSRGLVHPEELRRLFREIEPRLNRFPAIDPDVLREKLEEALSPMEQKE
jgi:hypothetical protein